MGVIEESEEGKKFVVLACHQDLSQSLQGDRKKFVLLACRQDLSDRPWLANQYIQIRHGHYTVNWQFYLMVQNHFLFGELSLTRRALHQVDCRAYLSKREDCCSKSFKHMCAATNVCQTLCHWMEHSVNQFSLLLKGPWTLILTDFSFRSPLWYIPLTKYFHTVNTGIYPVPQ